ncbi:putative sodium-coupled neutral amino acid transporter 8 [Protopterus annectens]|uniref:putative sodium-coupled neutral amino acid transporter 8 n=1 Tax=Protopterus annectens TaxID=7888 RepID=UPI001CFA80F0|nr:putative sodium-coupled neutral amino acid transporter 8 [Protopterus annectens]
MEELAKDSISLLVPDVDTDRSGLSSFGAVCIMLKTTLGVGLLNFPWAFNKAGGVYTSIAVEMVSLIFLISGLVMLGYASYISKESTYQGVVKQLCGPAIGRLCEVSYILNMFLVCVAFLQVAEDEVGKLCDYFYMNEAMTDGNGIPKHWYTDHKFGLFVICAVILLPLSVPKEIALQKYTSMLGTLAATFLAVAIIIKYYLMKDKIIFPEFHHTSRISSWASMFSVVPTICFGFQCHDASVAIYSSMKNKKLSNWILVCVLSMVFCLLIYSLTGAYGYLTFGADVAADILMSYPGNDVVIIIGRLLFGISIITIYPILLLLGRSVLNDVWLTYKRKYAIISEWYETFVRITLTVSWILATMLIAMFVPDISDVITLIGGISGFFIFIFPGLCLVCAMQTEPVSPKIRNCWIVWGSITIICGAFIFGQSTTIAVMEVFLRK